MISSENFVVVTSEEFLAAPLVPVLAERALENVTFVCVGGAQSMDVSSACEKSGIDCFMLSSKSSNTRMLRGVISPCGVTTILCIGSVAEALVGELASVSTEAKYLVLSLRLASSVCCGDPPETGFPSLPEFFPIWSGASEVSLQIVSSDGTARLETLIPLSVADTAIAVRYKSQREVSQLVLRFFDLGSQDQERLFTSGTVSLSGNHSNTSRNKLPVRVNPHLFSLEKAEAFIRACSFPLLEPPTVLSELPEDAGQHTEYFLDSFEHYVHYLRQLNPVLDEQRLQDLNRQRHAEAGLSQLASMTGYSNDTHWYSNVGGSIVKIQAETLKLRKRDNVSTLVAIPGQALGKDAKKRLRMNEPLIGLMAPIYVNRALSSGWIGVEGPYIRLFEAAISRVCGTAAAVAVQSGTAALYGAMKALGVTDASHHVVVPSYTCAACADAIVHAGGLPIATDCELDSYGLDFESVKRALEQDDQIVGVVIAPCYGVPSRDHAKVWELCRSMGLWLCEDNCETYGASMQVEGEDFGEKVVGSSSNLRRGVAAVGSQSTMSVISVRSEKMVGVGEGGAILSKDAALVSKARWWCSRAPVRGCGLWRVYEHESIGQNFRLPELLGAVGLAAVENLPVMIQRKRQIHEWYRENLLSSTSMDDETGTALRSFLRLQTPKPRDEPVWWLNSLKIDVPALPSIVQARIQAKQASSKSFNLAESVGLLLMQKNPHIEIRPAFFPLHKMSTFAKAAQPCPNCEEVYNTLLCVPSSAQLESEDVREVCNALKEAFGEALELPQ